MGMAYFINSISINNNYKAYTINNQGEILAV